LTSNVLSVRRGSGAIVLEVMQGIR
jgi:hypothetical protein